MSNEIHVHWRKNLFKVPSGKAGKAFVIEIARLLRAYAEAETLEAIEGSNDTACTTLTETLCIIKSKGLHPMPGPVVEAMEGR